MLHLVSGKPEFFEELSVFSYVVLGMLFCHLSLSLYFKVEKIKPPPLGRQFLVHSR